MNTVKCMVKRKSDGVVLPCIDQSGGDICTVEDFSYWTQAGGTVYRQHYQWHNADRYLEMGVLVVTNEARS